MKKLIKSIKKILKRIDKWFDEPYKKMTPEEIQKFYNDLFRNRFF